MALIINIETSQEICSVAITRNGKCIEIIEENEANVHSSKLTVFINEILGKMKLTVNEFDAVAVSSGPGSYTGLRIGVAVAKGLCYASGIKLIAVPTHQAIAYAVKSVFKNDDIQIICPVTDARRMEVYYSLYNLKLDEISGAKPLVLEENSFSDYLLNNKILFCGNAAEKCKSIIKSGNAIFYEDAFISARNIGFLAEEKFNKSDFVDVAYFEPNYLKEFIAGISTKTILKNQQK